MVTTMTKKTKADTTAKKETKKEEHKNHMINVQRVHELDNGVIMCDVKVNDVTIYGCTYKELQYKDGSGSFWKFDFPKRKGNDGKYYNHAFFFVTDDDLETIDSQIEELINQ